MQKVNTRKLAFKILEEIKLKGEISDRVINKYFEKNTLDKRDENLVRKIVYGCLENEILLDYYINKISTMKFSKIDEQILIVLRIGLYQILFLDKVPNSAAVNESVKIAKKINYRTKGFVNGVLRNFIRKKDEITINNNDKAYYLGIKYSYPKWMVDYFIDNYEIDRVEKMFDFNKKTPKLSIRTNTLKISREDLIPKLNELDIECEESKLTKDGILINRLNNNRITELELFKKGFFYIQDDASILVGEILDPKADDKVLDVCAAPGGKSTHLAQIMDDRGKIISRDISNYKINLIKENIDRLGIKSIDTQVFDATKEDLSNINKFDKILVDAPCSGLGIIRRKPEIKLNRKEVDIDTISSLQYRILNESAKLLKSGGNLVYSTCTIGRKENIDIVNKFIKNNNNFEIVKINDRENIQLLPGDFESDGFFICKIARK